MDHPLPRPVLFLCLALAASSPGAADDKAPAPAAAAKPAAPAADPVLALPKMEVTAQRAKKIDREIKRLDKLIERETKKIKTTELDRALNNEKVARAASIFGGNSADHLSAVAASRVALLEQERDVLEALKRPNTLDEVSVLEKELEELRVTRRNLDNVEVQR